MQPPRVLLVDDHRLLCEAFTKLLEPHCEVIGAVGDGREALALARKLVPDIVVMDIAMPMLNGLDATRQLREKMPEVRIIFLTMNEDPDLMAEAFRIGASGYLLKNSATSELLNAIKEVYQGHTYVTSLFAGKLAGATLQKPCNSSIKFELSARQREVLQLLVEGRSMKEVARILKITPRTVAFHKYSLMKELKIETNAELVQYAIKHRIITPR
jgi:DNA-binding NarL/FixJ family response regulator